MNTHAHIQVVHKCTSMLSVNQGFSEVTRSPAGKVRAGRPPSWYLTKQFIHIVLIHTHTHAYYKHVCTKMSRHTYTSIHVFMYGVKGDDTHTYTSIHVFMYVCTKVLRATIHTCTHRYMCSCICVPRC